VTSNWFFLSTLNYDARSTTHQIFVHYILCPTGIKLRTEGINTVMFSTGQLCDTGYHNSHRYFGK